MSNQDEDWVGPFFGGLAVMTVVALFVSLIVGPCCMKDARDKTRARMQKEAVLHGAAHYEKWPDRTAIKFEWNE